MPVWGGGRRKLFFTHLWPAVGEGTLAQQIHSMQTVIWWPGSRLIRLILHTTVCMHASMCAESVWARACACACGRGRMRKFSRGDELIFFPHFFSSVSPSFLVLDFKFKVYFSPRRDWEVKGFQPCDMLSQQHSLRWTMAALVQLSCSSRAALGKHAMCQSVMTELFDLFPGRGELAALAL